METLTKQSTVQPAVNTGKFLSSMKYMFAGSFSVLSELMQNARRAKATRIDFTFDAAAKRLAIQDDGIGIDDFSLLVRLCDSGWDQATVNADSPFGMGFYATFFACEQVTIMSNGLSMTASLNDIERQQSIVTQPATGIGRGTTIVMEGLDEALLKTEDNYFKDTRNTYQIIGEIAKMSLGFPIPVAINGVEQERPHAQSVLQGADLEIGFCHIDHLHNDKPMAVQHEANEVALYLQGLPIERSVKNAWAVVHLDSRRFKPVMPDRTHLYDGKDQVAAVQKTLRLMIAMFLVEKKRELAGEIFVQRYWEVCQNRYLAEWSVKKLLNDIPFMPNRCFREIAEIEDRDSFLYANTAQGLMGRDDEQIRHAWRDVPDNVTDSAKAGALLKYMQREDIHSVETNGLDPEHWIFTETPSCEDMVVQIEHDGVQATRIIGLSADVEVRLVKQIKLQIRLPNKPELVHVVENDWVVHVEQHHEDRSESKVVCYVMAKDSSIDHPACALDSFRDEHDHYNELWAYEMIGIWDSMVVAMRGGSLQETVSKHVRGIGLVLPDCLVGKTVLVYAQASWDEWSKGFGGAMLTSLDLEDVGVWERLADKLKGETAINGEGLKAMFLQAARVEARVGQPEASEQAAEVEAA